MSTDMDTFADQQAAGNDRSLFPYVSELDPATVERAARALDEMGRWDGALWLPEHHGDYRTPEERAETYRDGLRTLARAALAAAAQVPEWECGHLTQCADAACSYNPAMQAWVAQPAPEADDREANPDEAHDIGYTKGHIDGYREAMEEARRTQPAPRTVTADERIGLAQAVNAAANYGGVYMSYEHAERVSAAALAALRITVEPTP